MVRGIPVDPTLVSVVFKLFSEKNKNLSAVGRVMGNDHKWVKNVIENYDPETKKRKVVKPKGRSRITSGERDAEMLVLVQAKRELSAAKIAVEAGLAHRTLLNRLREFKTRRSDAVLDELT
ncbi:hypothetical protein RvY_07392 [Ramazzottius varieornatus]|uniref:Uncharacterized protein n=1 Tax=Ramazzottius varieornatus TaxID=947166 RepID=A0A1D1V840_RAMVA|nr:hypothetical protein RvY_07392 [Ramazzottius varieornatus]